MSFAFLKDKFWITGIACAVIGAVLFKFIARMFTEPLYNVIVYIAGVTIALSGLVIIMFGVSRRYKTDLS